MTRQESFRQLNCAENSKCFRHRTDCTSLSKQERELQEKRLKRLQFCLGGLNWCKLNSAVLNELKPGEASIRIRLKLINAGQQELIRNMLSEYRMLKVGDDIELSASDLVGHLNCRYLTDLDLAVANGQLEKPKHWDPFLKLLQERGAIHEKAFLDHLKSEGYQVFEVEGVGTDQALVDQTITAMRACAQIIFQGAFRSDGWVGRTDILKRVETPSDLGDWSYEVIDTKLSRETKGGTLLQLSLYSDLVASVQGRMPDQMHVVAPWSEYKPQSFRTADYAAFYRKVADGLKQSIGRSR